MNLYFRLFYMLIASFFKARIARPTDESSLRFRVLPTDLDLNGHMNNGRYLTIMDIGRMDYVIRLGMAMYVIRNKYIPVISSAAMRYRLPLLPWQKYELKSRTLCWDDKWVYMEHRFILKGGKKDGAIAAIGLVKAGFFDRKNRTMVTTAHNLAETGHTMPSPPMPTYIQKWAESEETLREEMAQQSP